MIEISTAVVVLGFAAWLILQQRSDSRLCQIQWVIDASRLRRSLAEFHGDEKEAERITELASDLNLGLAIVMRKMPIEGGRQKEVHRAAMTASGDDWLRALGVSNYSSNYMPAKAALYWLAGKFSSKA